MIHNKHTQKIKKTFLSQYLNKCSSTVPAGIQGLALRRERRWRYRAEGMSSRRWRASCNFTCTWRDQTRACRSHLCKFTAWSLYVGDLQDTTFATVSLSKKPLEAPLSFLNCLEFQCIWVTSSGQRVSIISHDQAERGTEDLVILRLLSAIMWCHC